MTILLIWGVNFENQYCWLCHLAPFISILTSHNQCDAKQKWKIGHFHFLDILPQHTENGPKMQFLEECPKSAPLFYCPNFMGNKEQTPKNAWLVELQRTLMFYAQKSCFDDKYGQNMTNLPIFGINCEKQYCWFGNLAHFVWLWQTTKIKKIGRKWQSKKKSIKSNKPILLYKNHCRTPQIHGKFFWGGQII